MPPIFFSRGVPSPEVLPVAQLRDCAAAVLAREAPTVLNYGPPGGYRPLRELLAAEHGVPAGRVLVTTGSLAGFNFVARHLFQAGGRAVAGVPIYDRSLLALRAAGATVETVALSDAGHDLAAMERLLDTDPRPQLVYCVPTFHNPSGRTLSLEQRQALVDLARRYQVLIYEDDPYRLVRYGGEPLPSLYQLAGGEGVIFSTSFSKTCAPGLRVGYLVLPEQLVAPVEGIAATTYIGPPLLPQAIVHEFLTAGHFDATVAAVKAGLGARRDAMLAALEQHMPEGASWSRPEGGYFLWLDLPDGHSGAALAAAAAERGVELIAGADFYPAGGGEESVRIAFSFPSVAEIEAGVATLGELLR